MDRYKDFHFSFKRGFSLAELIVILVIVALSVALGIPSYRKAIQKAQEKEVTVFSEALRDAEHQYYLEHDTYVECGYEGVDECNAVLQVSLPQGREELKEEWQYFVKSDDLTSYFCVGAENTSTKENYCLAGDIDQTLSKGACAPEGCQ